MKHVLEVSNKHGTSSEITTAMDVGVLPYLNSCCTLTTVKSMCSSNYSEAAASSCLVMTKNQLTAMRIKCEVARRKLQLCFQNSEDKFTVQTLADHEDAFATAIIAHAAPVSATCMSAFHHSNKSE